MNFSKNRITNISIYILLLTSASLQAVKSYKDIKTKEEYQRITKGSKPSIITYSAPWCGACTKFHSVFGKVCQNYGDIDFCTIDLTKPKFKYILKEEKIKSYPTTIFRKGGKEVRREAGSMSEEEFGRQVKQFSGKK